ncbi:Arrestin-like, N-terminal and Immunoglobulin E-set domain protein [Pseudohyphozyma bogoriensis]|nr:Arrestin-like, N-terminal and Immunoglobulin E-set domain protein [Pseudohyphozyma bogoriensis]
MLCSLFYKPTLKLSVDQEHVTVYPPKSLSDEPTLDTIFRGTVTLHLPTSRAVGCLKVSLKGLCDAWGGDGYPYESNETLNKRVRLDLNGEIMKAGQHSFNFAIVIPATTAVTQSSTYGRVRHHVRAKVEFSSGFLPTLSSELININITAASTTPEDLPESTEIIVEHFSSDLGPISIELSSPHLTVASLLALKVVIPSPPLATKILSIESFIQQSFTILYADTSLVVRPPARRYKLHYVDQHEEMSNSSQPVVVSKPLAVLNPEGSFSYAKLARCPTETHIKPTTLEGTETRIRVSSAIVVEMRYKIEGGDEKVVVVNRPVVLDSVGVSPLLRVPVSVGED